MQVWYFIRIPIFILNMFDQGVVYLIPCLLQYGVYLQSTEGHVSN